MILLGYFVMNSDNKKLALSSAKTLINYDLALLLLVFNNLHRPPHRSAGAHDPISPAVNMYWFWCEGRSRFNRGCAACRVRAWRTERDDWSLRLASDLSELPEWLLLMKQFSSNQPSKSTTKLIP